MSKLKDKPASVVAVPTRSHVKAQAHALGGAKSRVALAAADDNAPDAPETPGVTVGELWLYGVVGGWWFGFDAESVSRALRGLDVDLLYVRIHSPGGAASEGIAIGNLLRNHAAHVVVVVDGLAASAASVIAIAGDEIVMCPGSQLMLHDASTYGYGNAADLRLAADWIDQMSANYAGVYAYKAGGTPESWRQVMLANGGYGTWYTAEAAVTAGLADSVGTRVATGSPPTAPEEQLDDLDDEDMYARAAHDVQLLEQAVHPAARATWRGERPKPPAASADGSTPEGKDGSAVAFSTEQIADLRKKLGVAEDADEATMLAALDEALEERADASTAPTNPTGGSALPDGVVTIEKDVLAALQSQAAEGATARKEQLETHRDSTIAQAIADGKITPGRKAHWVSAWNADPKGTQDSLASLAKGLVPTEDIGDAESDSASADVRETDAYKNWEF